ncbi:MAG: HTTM domain-containing protein [Planctomycetes bacterium]|nr:HTTM domain-containing protein [Planctomycetota bacterium]
MQNTTVRKNHLSELFALDLRSLGLFRIGIALILLYDLLLRSSELSFFYTDQGATPREVLWHSPFPMGVVWWISPHMLSGSFAWQAFLFILSALAGIALLLGYRTLWAVAISWFLLMGSHARQPMILQGNDVLLRCALFWSFFVPLGARFSLDSLSKNAPTYKSNRILSWGTAAIILQLCILYFNAAIPKVSYEWRGDFNALYYVISMDYFTKPFGYWILQYPAILVLLTKATLLLEVSIPFLLLMPLGNAYLRLIAFATMVGFHLGIYMCMDVGLFSFMCIAYWLVFLPSLFWDKVATFIPWKFLGSGTEDTSPEVLATPGPRLLIPLLLKFVMVMNYQRYLNPPMVSDEASVMDTVGRITGLDQYWAMFSPGVLKEGLKIWAEGTKADGSKVNLFNPTHDNRLSDRRMVWTKEDSYARKRFLIWGLYEFPRDPFSRAFLKMMLEEWNKTHNAEEQIISAQIISLKTQTSPPYETLDSPTINEKILMNYIPQPKDQAAIRSAGT